MRLRLIATIGGFLIALFGVGGAVAEPSVSVTAFTDAHSVVVPLSGSPQARTARCGSPIAATTRSGGSPPPGRHQLHRRRHQQPDGDHGRARRRPVVHQPRQQLDRADHHRRGRSPTTTAPASATRTGSRPGPDGALWFTNAADNSIGRITTTGTVTNYTGPDQRPDGDRGRARRRPVVHQPGQQLDRADHHHRDGHNYTRRRHQRPDGITAGPDGALWFTNTGNNSIGRITTAGTVTNYTGPGISQPGRDHGRARRRPVVHQPGQQLDRADHHRRGRHQLHRPRHHGPTEIAAGPDGALWFTSPTTTSIGRITTTGVVTNYTDAGISCPDGIAAGPDGALWFTNQGNNSIGRITTAG